VLLEAIAGRVITESGSDGLLNATGVEFLHAGTTHLVKAKKEVILCAGCVRVRCSLQSDSLDFASCSAVSRRPSCSSFPGSETGLCSRRREYL
jgi:hypothetical protein